MNRILILLLLLPAIAWGQTTSTTQTTQVDNTIRGKIYNPASSADMFQALINSRADGTASGTNTYTVTTNGARLTAYSQVNTLRITFTNANTSTTCSLNANSIGTLSIKGNDGNDLAVGALKAGGTYDLKYNGTNLRVMNDGSGSGGGFSNPMTTAGDIIYGGASGTPTRLATGSGFLKGGTTPSWASVSLAADVTTSISGLLKGNGSAVVQAVLNTDYTNPAYVDAKVADAINDGTTTIAPSQNAVFDALALKSNAFTTIATDATTARTIVTGDNLKKINFSNAGAITITLNSSAAVGTAVWIWKEAGSGDITLTTSGTTLKAPDNQLLTDETGAVVVYEGSNVWSASGNLGASGGGGTGTVTDVSVVTANGISGSVATSTTTPAITLTLGAITPTSVNSVVVSGSSTPTLAVTGTTTVSGTHSGTSSGTNTGDQTNITGNAATVTTNANLTGPVTSTGNATAIASSIALPGSPTTTTQSLGTNNTTISTTAYADRIASLKAGFGYRTITTYTASHTATASDTATFVVMNVATPNNFILPKNSTTALRTGTMYTFARTNATTSVIGEDVTVTITYSATISADPCAVCPVQALKTGTNSWYVFNSSPPLNTDDITVSDDNVVDLLISGGSGIDAVLAAFNISASLGGIVNEAHGGTNQSSYTAGQVLWASANNTLSKRDVLNTSPTFKWHLAAGSATAGTAPEGFTSGPLLTTIVAGAKEYNGDHYESTSGLNRLGRGGPIADFITDANNTSTTETDLYTYTTKASTLSVNGAKLVFDVAGTLNDITSTAQIQFYFGGTVVGNTGALTVSATGAWSARIIVIRTGTTTARASVAISTPGASTASYTSETDLTGLTFTNTNIMKVTGTAGGAGGGSSDITAKLGTIIYWPAAVN